MIRFASPALVAALVLISVSPTFASEKDGNKYTITAPSKAVADAWAREDAVRPSSKALKGLHAAYIGLQAADMWTTIAARERGAIEVNPLMDGNYGQAAAFKALMTASTVMASRKIAKKSKKAAIVTMVLLNGVSAAIVANNIKNARR